MQAAAGLTWAFALLVGVAGVTKIATPDATGAALQGAKLPSDRRVVRALGAGEVLLASAVLVVGGAVPAALLAVTYVVFALFAHRQSRRGESCGCFGSSDAPATRLHVAVNAVGALVAAGAAVLSAPTPLAATDGDPVRVALVAVLLVVAAQLLRLTLTAVPELTTAIALHTGQADP